MDKEEVRRIVKEYAKTVLENMNNVKSIVLFGSYARGNNHKYSDIDIAVIIPKNAVSTNILEQMAELFKLSYNISSDIEPVLLVDGEDKSGFQEHILSYGEVIYSKTA